MGFTIDNCGRMSLKTASSILAYINLTVGILSKMAWGSLWVYTIKNMSNKEAIPSVCWIFATVVCIYLIYIIFTLVLIFGLRENKRTKIKIFLIYAIILFGKHMIVLIFFVLTSLEDVPLWRACLDAYCLFICVLLAVSLYTIFSYFKKMVPPVVSPAGQPLVTRNNTQFISV